MKKLIPVLVVTGLMFNACGPTDEEVRATEDQIEAASEDAMDDIIKMADEASDEIDSAAPELIVDSLMVQEDTTEEAE